ncbi:MAG: hypothetical protein K9N51_01285 [Candidatus Pacebacteria bacterium]|nr:hypothetical protein [Candidatus Paceibacterota bacterium]
MLQHSFIALCLAGMTVLTTVAGQAADRFYYLPLQELPLIQGEIPKTATVTEAARKIPWRQRRNLRTYMQPYGVGHGGAEVYLEFGGQQWRPSASAAQNVADTHVAIRVPQGAPARGKLFIPSNAWSEMQPLTFELPGSQASQKNARDNFFRAKELHYQRLLRLSVPGAAWFRHEMLSARLARKGEKMDKHSPLDSAAQRNAQQQAGDLRETYDLFTGGRAVSENLQLDRVLQVGASEDEETVPINNIEGITTAEIDWSETIAGMNPDRDTLASTIPGDQHALFFPSFTAMVRMMDEAAEKGTPVLHLLEPRSEDARTRERYEKQLCLKTDELSRKLGPQLISSVAFTGSDPYLRTGSDLAVVFETKNAMALAGLIAARQGAVLGDQVQAVSGTVAGVQYQGVVSPWREVSSYLATQGSTVVVANSASQLELVLKTGQGALPGIADAPEYVFFRDRYSLGEDNETAFLVLTDATIRRWCGPHWRIAASRRARAAAAMAEMQARYLNELTAGRTESQTIPLDEPVPGLGELKLTPAGIASKYYGTLNFLTPIRELNIAKATQAEVQAYEWFRRNYQRRWQAFFDPIAVRFSLQDDKLHAALTVRPLIAASDYRQFMAVTGNAAIEPGNGDPHEESMIHFVMSLDKEADQVRQFSSFAGQMAPGLQVNPLDWIGNWLALYVDRDPMWQELGNTVRENGPDAVEDYMEEHAWRMPAALTIDVANGFKLTAFLTALRGFIEQTAPQMTAWETRTHNDLAYVRITPSAQARSDMREGAPEQNLAVHYAATGTSLVVSLNEDVIKRALDRVAAKRQAKAAAEPAPEFGRPWLGRSLAAQAGKGAVDVLQTLYQDSMARAYQRRSWGNLFILNEWRHRFGAEDPVAFHQKHWGIRLVCPGGGAYQWNETFQSMASTVYGHPGEPALGEPAHDPWESIVGANLGLTFEENGLRAEAALYRSDE